MKLNVTTWPSLPDNVAGDSYRFFCTFLRSSILDNTITLLIDGDEFTLPERHARVGLVAGKLCVDVKTITAKNLKLC